MSFLYRLIPVTGLIVALNISGTATANVNNQAPTSQVALGYSALKTFLEDK